MDLVPICSYKENCRIEPSFNAGNAHARVLLVLSTSGRPTVKQIIKRSLL